MMLSVRVGLGRDGAGCSPATRRSLDRRQHHGEATFLNGKSLLAFYHRTTVTKIGNGLVMK